MTAVLAITDLVRTYADTPVFSGVQLQLQPGEFVALLGESGVGKSTLLNCIAGLDDADAGHIRLAGIDVRTLAEPGRAKLRREKLTLRSLTPHAELSRSMDRVEGLIRSFRRAAAPQMGDRCRTSSCRATGSSC